MDHRVQVFVRDAKAAESGAERISVARVRLGPARSELNARDGIVPTADADALSATLVTVASLLPVARVVAALTSAHGLQL
jgi:hypothetical protein